MGWIMSGKDVDILAPVPVNVTLFLKNKNKKPLLMIKLRWGYNSES